MFKHQELQMFGFKLKIMSNFHSLEVVGIGSDWVKIQQQYDIIEKIRLRMTVWPAMINKIMVLYATFLQILGQGETALQPQDSQFQP